MEETIFNQKERKNIFATAFEESFKNDSFATDVVIKAGAEKCELHCHRLVLASSSNFLKALLLTTTPGITPVILLPDISVAVVKIILTYVYYGEVSIPSENFIEVKDAFCLLQIKPYNESLGDFNSVPQTNEKIEIITNEQIEKNGALETNDEIEEEQNIEDLTKDDQNIELKLEKSKRNPKKICIRSESVDPLGKKLIQVIKKLQLRVKEAYESLQIPINSQIEKRISESKVVVKDGIVLKGIHYCGLCDSDTYGKFTFNFTVSSKGKILVFRVGNLKQHLKNKHAKVIELVRN